LLRRRRLE
jgi:hypothetical protein